MRPLWFILSAAAVAAACSSDTPLKNIDEGCNINSDCSSPLVCAFRKCHMACTDSRDCPAGQRCMASDRPFHVCQLNDERECSFNSDCPTGQVCGIDGQCRDQCVGDRDCLPLQECVSSTCADVKELVDGGLPLAMPAEGGAPSHDIPCLYTSECPDPLICRGKVCAPECLMTSDCPVGSCVNQRCVTGSGTLIGPEGGSVTSSDGHVTLSIPAASLRSQVSILLLPLEAWPAGALGAVYQILPTGLQFDPAATLTFHYADVDLGGTPLDQVKVGNAVGPQWVALPSVVDATKKTISASLAHLSTYGLVGPGINGNQPVDASVSVDTGVPSDVADAGPLPKCEVECLATGEGACDCRTTSPCVGHGYACSGTGGTCTCSKDDGGSATINAASCVPALLTDAPPNGCGYPFIGTLPL
jgi:hypothetical protein